MPSIGTETPPSVSDPFFKDYLVRMRTAINIALNSPDYFAPRSTLPRKFRVGSIYYFSQAIPLTDITCEGLWIYKSTGWTLIA